jgi:cellulose synthase (UDP-forming)
MARLRAPRPRFSTRESELLAREVGVCFALYGLYYVVWRAGWTLNLHALWLALPLLVAEAMGYIDFCLFLFMSWRVPEPTFARPPDGLSVDVYITTYNESPEILRSTILGAVHMRYPHETYVLDDGGRAEIAALATQLGAQYIARTEHEHAKAGNINHALTVTPGELVAVFDADHVPHPQFLERTLQYFSDERVALVQTPQEFYNVDSIQHASARHEGEAHWHEQALFYRVIQPGKDRSNAAFWCGSSAVLRRAALESIGGVATETITEDILTTIKLHGAGWRTRYHNEILATGIAPDDLDAFLTQRKRWAQGAMQILRSRYNPLWAKGLSVRQRLSYWASMSTYFASFQKLVLLLTPIVVLSTGILPMRAFGWDFAAHFVPYFVLGLAANSLSGRGYGRYFDTERFNLLKAFAFVRASLALVIPRALRFEVTRKSQQMHAAREYLAALPHLTLLVSSICAMGWAAYEIMAHGLGGPQQLALELTAVWAVYNAGVVGLAVRAVLSRSHRRARYRFTRRVPLVVEQVYPPDRYQVSTTDMTPDGLSFTHASALARGTQVVVDLDLPGGASLHSTALVMNSVPLGADGPFRVGVQFTELTDGDRDALTLYLFTGETDGAGSHSEVETQAAA